MPAASLGQDATLSFVVTGKGQKAGWLIREFENQKISHKDEFFTAYCAKRPELFEGLTDYFLPSNFLTEKWKYAQVKAVEKTLISATRKKSILSLTLFINNDI